VALAVFSLPVFVPSAYAATLTDQNVSCTEGGSHAMFLSGQTSYGYISCGWGSVSLANFGLPDGNYDLVELVGYTPTTWEYSEYSPYITTTVQMNSVGGVGSLGSLVPPSEGFSWSSIDWSDALTEPFSIAGFLVRAGLAIFAIFLGVKLGNRMFRWVYR